MRSALTATAMFLCLPALAVAQPGGRYDYLVKATDQIIRLSESEGEPSPEAIEAAAAAGCGALARLLDDPAFVEDLARLQKAPRYQKERAELKKDLRLFTTGFMRWEQQTLEKAGLSRYAADSILWSVVALRGAADADPPPNEVVGRIKALRDELCGAAKTAWATRKAAERRDRLATWGMRIGGVLVISVNAAATVSSAGAVGWFALASGSIGGGMMGISFSQ